MGESKLDCNFNGYLEVEKAASQGGGHSTVVVAGRMAKNVAIGKD